MDAVNPIVANATTLSGLAHTCTVTALAGASNVSTVTIQAVDVGGLPISGVHHFVVITTSDSAGTTISATNYSGSLVAVTGTLLITWTAKHAFLVSTDANGRFVGSLTDTAKTADYIAVSGALAPKPVVSAAAAYGA